MTAEQRSEPTPGPWNVQGAAEFDGEGYGQPDIAPFRIIGNGWVLASVIGDVSDINAEANARLIAAAPETAAQRDRLEVANVELLDALTKAVGLCSYCDGTGKAYTHEDEMAVGCSPGQSEIPCAACEEPRAVLAKHGDQS